MNRLIAAVAAHPVLYATSKRQLKSQEVQQQRFAAWAEIAKKLKYTQRLWVTFMGFALPDIPGTQN
ncbi:hypothetical protein PSTG_19124 [Puccinia striiformis f. sp. tritici PST-78]|uniref:MADF domain-containing protein n=1 Tax=Puccinia striiformis f. sp. tritici PST-78 TaxID=1165861 RepID=A0A0L0UKH7_9BASI|nr:hypothetical protein PSTG_19124 [Puccinia striiformis f. sp. tritici PST-78]